MTEQGGADGFFFLGPKYTRKIMAALMFGRDMYGFELVPTADGKLMLDQEFTQYHDSTISVISSGQLESVLKNRKNDISSNETSRNVEQYIHSAISNWTVYHFHDTSMLAPMRRDQSVRDRNQLRPDASNIAVFLLNLRGHNPNSYNLIRDTVRLIAPFFDDFILHPETNGGQEHVRLEWRQKGSDFPFQPFQLSDGTIRFVCLTAALLQPSPPATILIDEPELGLHPYAITLLAGLIRSASEQTQVIVSTQSPSLLDHFHPEEIIVVNRKEGESIFQRLDQDSLKEWLEEYSLGELWQKNIVNGGPVHE